MADTDDVEVTGARGDEVACTRKASQIAGARSVVIAAPGQADLSGLIRARGHAGV